MAQDGLDRVDEFVTKGDMFDSVDVARHEGLGQFRLLGIENQFFAIESGKRIDSLLQWSAVRVTAVTVTVGYSDSFCNPRFLSTKRQAVRVTKNRLQ